MYFDYKPLKSLKSLRQFIVCVLQFFLYKQQGSIIKCHFKIKKVYFACYIHSGLHCIVYLIPNGSVSNLPSSERRKLLFGLQLCNYGVQTLTHGH